VDIVSVLKDINVNVVSAEIDTIGGEAKDELFVTYHGEPLSGPMTQLVTNALQVRRGGCFGVRASFAAERSSFWCPPRAHAAPC
jgi:hypothetical protein